MPIYIQEFRLKASLQSSTSTVGHTAPAKPMYGHADMRQLVHELLQEHSREEQRRKAR